MKPGRYPPRCGTRFLDLRDEAEALPHERPDDRHSRLTAADAVETAGRERLHRGPDRRPGRHLRTGLRAAASERFDNLSAIKAEIGLLSRKIFESFGNPGRPGALSVLLSN